MIYPEGTEKEALSSPLTITKTKRTAMVKKAFELLTKPMESKELANAIEQYYVFEKNEHYTSAQLKDIVDQVITDLIPPPTKEELAEIAAQEAAAEAAAIAKAAEETPEELTL